MLNTTDSFSSLHNIDDITDMEFNITKYSPISTIGIRLYKSYKTGTSHNIHMSPVGGSWLHYTAEAIEENLHVPSMFSGQVSHKDQGKSTLPAHHQAAKCSNHKNMGKGGKKKYVY